jgi:ribonuclease HI
MRNVEIPAIRAVKVGGLGKKIYAVVKGVQPGLYDDWAKAAPNVQGFAGAVFKGFASLDEATDWFEERVGQPPQVFFVAAKPAANPINKTNLHAEALTEGKVVVYTDGGADPNPGPGGYGVVMLFGAPPKTARKELSAGFVRTTNNRMEIRACMAALSELKRPSDVVIFTDSQYLANAIEKNWAMTWREKGWRLSNGEPAVNADLWAQLLELLERHTVAFVWVKGHAGTRENERCDALATRAMRGRMLLADEGFEG